MKLPWSTGGEPPEHENCRSIPPFPPGIKVRLFLDGILIDEGIIGMNMTDDEKIDFHETERIFKLYGVEE